MMRVDNGTKVSPVRLSASFDQSDGILSKLFYWLHSLSDLVHDLIESISPLSVILHLIR